MADRGARYDMGAPIFQVRTDFGTGSRYATDNGFFSRIFPNTTGLRHALRARKRYRQYGVAGQKIYVCFEPEWVEITEKDLDAMADYDESRIAIEIERIRALHGAMPTETNPGEARP